MAVNLNIQADIIDIKTDTPQQNDIFLVDTNVTNDMDYAVVPGIQVFTSNKYFIQEAKLQQKLVTSR